jgi:hypothetical protein
LRRPTTYRRGPAVGEALERRQRGQAPEIINISWRAQRRLNARWRQLKDTRRKPGGIVAIAIARELAGYCWEIATCTCAPVSPAGAGERQGAVSTEPPNTQTRNELPPQGGAHPILSSQRAPDAAGVKAKPSGAACGRP